MKLAGNSELTLSADGSISSIGGALISGGDTTISAGGDVDIRALRLESERASTGSGGTEQSRTVRHELATVDAGGELLITAGGDLTVSGARVTAGEDATLFAVGDTTIESVQDHASSGSRQGRNRSSETSTATQRTTISAGGELTVGSATGDVRLDAVSLASGGDTILSAAEGQVLLLTETDETGSTSFRRRTSQLEWSETDQGRREETIEHVELEYGGELRISASEGVVVEYERDGSVAGSLDELTVSPGLEWMNQLRGDASVEWRGVEANSESWYRTRSGLTAEGRAAAAREAERRRMAAAAAAAQAAAEQAAADNRQTGSGSDDPGLPDDPGLFDVRFSFSTGGGPALADVQATPRESPPQTSEGGSGSGSGNSQGRTTGGSTGGTTAGSASSTVTLETVVLTEPPLHDPFGLGPYGPAFVAGWQEQTSSTTVDLGSAEIELPTSDTGSDGNGAGGGYDFWSEFYTTGTGTSAGAGGDQPVAENEAPAGSPTDDQDDDRQKSLCELMGMLATFGCGDPWMELEPGQFVDQTDDQQADQQHVQLEEHFTISICFPFMPCWWEQAQTIVFVDRDDESRNPDEAEETAGNRSPWDDLPPTPDPQDVVQAAEDAADSSAAAGDSAAVVEPEPTVLQTGGNTIRNRTAQLLNEQFDMNLHRRDWGRALEALKDFVGQPGQLHGKIMSDGTLVDETGRVIGNILDFIP